MITRKGILSVIKLVSILAVIYVACNLFVALYCTGALMILGPLIGKSSMSLREGLEFTFDLQSLQVYIIICGAALSRHFLFPRTHKEDKK